MLLKRLFCKHNLRTFQCSYCGPTVIDEGKRKIIIYYEYKCNKCGKTLKYATLVEEVEKK